MDKLVLLQDGQATPFEISEDEMIIGRLPECEIQLPSNMVSRKHAVLKRSGEDVFIEDLGSGNGTFLNGQRIDQSTMLKGNDRLKFGPILMRFESDRFDDSESSSVIKHAVGINQVEIHDEDEGSSTIVNSLDSGLASKLFESRPQDKLKAVLEISRSLAGDSGRRVVASEDSRKSVFDFPRCRSGLHFAQG